MIAVKERKMSSSTFLMNEADLRSKSGFVRSYPTSKNLNKHFFSSAITKSNDLIRQLQSIIDSLLVEKVVLNHLKMQTKLPRLCNPKPYLLAKYMQLSLGHNQSTFFVSKLFKSINITTSMLPIVS